MRVGFGCYLLWWNCACDFLQSALTQLKSMQNSIQFWVRKLIGKLGVPYNRRLGVRGSSHPLNLCRRFITPRSGKQRFPYPLRFALPRAFDGIVDGFGFIRREPCANQDSLKFSLFDLWPANFIFHICLTFMLTRC